jgi:hypothetical protein
VKFGEAQEVTTAYVPVAEACEFVTGEGDGASPEKFPIVAVKSGWAEAHSAARQFLTTIRPPL